MSESCFSIIDLQRILAIKPPIVVKYQKRPQIGMFVVSVLYCSKVPSKQHSCVLTTVFVFQTIRNTNSI